MEAGGKIGGGGAGSEKAIGIVVGRQVHDVARHPGAFQALRELLSGLLAGLVFILVKDDVDRTGRPIQEWIELTGCQMRADGGSGVAEAGLPQYRQVEQAFYQDHRREEADRVPSEQALGTRQQPMGEGGTDTAAVQVNDLAVLAAGKDYAPAESVAALSID